MKENVLDVLMYLFEHYMDEDTELYPDREELKVELQEAGFPHVEVDQALEWLEGLVTLKHQQKNHPAQTGTSIRVYSIPEIKKMPVECRGFLQFLEQIGVLDHNARELVIDRIMALGHEEADMEQLKWVVLMVLFNQPGQESDLAWIEDLVFDERIGCLH
jgi:Smg protein